MHKQGGNFTRGTFYAGDFLRKSPPHPSKNLMRFSLKAAVYAHIHAFRHTYPDILSLSRTIPSSLLQPEKAYAPILVTFSGITMAVREEQSRKCKRLDLFFKNYRKGAKILAIILNIHSVNVRCESSKSTLSETARVFIYSLYAAFTVGVLYIHTASS